MTAFTHARRGLSNWLLPQPVSRRQRVVIALILIVFVGFDNYALGGWGSFFAALLVVVGCVVAVAAAPIVAAAAVVGVVVAEAAVVAVGVVTAVVGIGILAYEFGSTLAMGPPINRPPIASIPQPPSYVPPVLHDSYTPLPPGGNAADPMISTLNGSLSAQNALINNALAGKPTFASDLASYESTISPLSGQMSNVFGGKDLLIAGLTFSQADINAEKALIGTSGFPAALTSALTTGGYSAADIAAMRTYVSNTPLNISTASVSERELLTEAASLTTAPEPTSLVMLGTSCVALLAYSWVQHRQLRAAA